jgi:hypothetical protein
MNTLTKTLLASCALAMASSAMAMDSDAEMRKQTYNDAVYTAKSTYYNTIADCKNMTGADRRTCYTDAKTARKQAIEEARDQRRESAREDK